MLTYHCKYQDPSIGLHVAYMRLVYDWINPHLKRMSIEALKGDKDNQDKMDKLRLAGLMLFIRSVKQLEPLRNNLSELQKKQLEILDEYKKELKTFGISVTELDDFIERNSTDYLSDFI